MFTSMRFDDTDKEEEELMGFKILWVITGCFAFLSIVISVQLIRAHLAHFSHPVLQSKIIGILWMVPIYTVDSWLSLRFKSYALYLDMIRDCYESYILYLFLALMIGYIGQGDEEHVIKVINDTMADPSSNMPSKTQKTTWSWFNSSIEADDENDNASEALLYQNKNPNVFNHHHISRDDDDEGRTFLRQCKFATMQFVVIKPLSTFCAIILDRHGLYDAGHFRLHRGYIYITIVLNVSISYAFYYLARFYVVLAKPLHPYHPIPKFLCIKFILFLSFWQSVLLDFCTKWNILGIHAMGHWSSEQVDREIQNALICVEMLGAALAHRIAFPVSEIHKVMQDHHPALSSSSSSLLILNDDDDDHHHHEEQDNLGLSGSHTRRESEGGIFSRHLSIKDALRDFNQVMPVVIPSSGFRPGRQDHQDQQLIEQENAYHTLFETIIRTAEIERSNERLLMNEQNEQAQGLCRTRGFKL